MDYLLSQYKKRVKQELSPSDFIPFHKTFYRIINDVLQKVFINRNRYGCHIEYDILPLSLPVDNPACFYGGSYVIDSGWVFSENKAEAIDPIMNNIVQTIKTDTLPFFERATNSKNAYTEIIKLENRIYSSVIMNDIAKVYFCVKNNDYENAKKHMKAIVSQNEDAISSNISMFEEER